MLENYCKVCIISSFQLLFILNFKTKIDGELMLLITRINSHYFVLIKYTL